LLAFWASPAASFFQVIRLSFFKVVAESLPGYAFSASNLGIPALGLAPVPLRLQQWLVIYDVGKYVSPPVSITSAVSWATAAWISHSQGGDSEWKLYAVAALATASVLGFTVLAMLPTNKELIRRAKVVTEAKGDELDREFEAKSEELIGLWDSLNYVRAVLPMVAAWVGLYAALK
jgi:hypothetical protein